MIRALLWLLALASPAGAFELAPFKLAWPVDCTLGQTCHIQHYLDRDPGPGERDFTCGTLSYDGHDGTDIALPNRAAMMAEVNVLAAAPGRVLGVRDGIADFVPPIPGKECGNGVLVDDGDGWQTQYCHMKQGTVAVRKGDLVTVGMPLGLVGQSGAADFPHLHLTVRHDGKPVDPFQPDQTACGPANSAGLWDAVLPYEPGGFLAAGFSSEVPQFSAIQAGLPTLHLRANAPALVLWAEVFGGQAGDVMDFSIRAPDGSIFHQTSATLERTQDQLFRAVGKKLHAPLPPGTYAGEVVLRRKGVEVGRISTEVIVQSQ
jgi:hypothetical protein